MAGRIGKAVSGTPGSPHGEIAADTEIVFVVAVDAAGFTYRVLSDPVLQDAEILHWIDFADIENVRPAV
jgi:hypothetical protein